MEWSFLQQTTFNLLNNCSEVGKFIGPNECDCYIGFQGRSCEQNIGENLNDPIISFDSYVAEIGEFATISEKVITVTATDIDKGKMD